MDEHQQTHVHLLLEMVQRQVVGVFTERVLKLNGDKVQGKQTPHGYKCEYAREDFALNGDCHLQGSEEQMEKQQGRNEIRVREWKLGVCNLFGVEEVDEPPRDRLIHT
eukprot:CAMPEP_0117560846 /NCGR_PEP_ID=MMETSP0784-20121206/54090_1 /TAXON_ID=39447 /ORGANISM="" /LENGTH=107 /DNA_ID=CAMNT_0005358275 /DNA_START=858 /DNA_END=1181 /DNA_ORIENTATION=-